MPSIIAQFLQRRQTSDALVSIGQTRRVIGLPRSSIHILREGFSVMSEYADIRPPMPPPIIMISYLLFIFYLRLQLVFDDLFTRQTRVFERAADVKLLYAAELCRLVYIVYQFFRL
jgi:hypothetical protein